MKIYVSVDLEGISGVARPSQLTEGEPHYQEARRLLTDEVNAVVEGLLLAGADEIIVKDAHGNGFNFLIRDLHPGADYCFGGTNFDNRFPGLDSSFDGAMLIGYHAMAGTERAILDHTYSSPAFTHIELNGRPFGEIWMDSLLFGLFGVPMLLVSGDDKTCAEAQRILGPHVTTYCTKIATGRHSGVLKSPQRVYKELKESIAGAVEKRNLCRPLQEKGPYELAVHYTSTSIADSRYCDGTESLRLDGLTVLYKDTDLIRLFIKGI